MTLEQMRRNIRFGLGLNEPEEQPIIDQKINEGIHDVLRRTGCTVLCFDADTPESDRLELGGAIQKLLYVYRNGVLLARVAPAALPRHANAFTQIGSMLIFSEAFSADEKLQLYAVPRPAPVTDPLVNLQDPPAGGIPEEFQDAIQLYALAELALLANDETSSRGGNYRIMYEGQTGREGRLAEIRREVNKTSGTLLGKAVLDYRLVGLRR